MITRRSILLGSAAVLVLPLPTHAQTRLAAGTPESNEQFKRSLINFDDTAALPNSWINLLEPSYGSSPAGYAGQIDAAGYANTPGSRANRLSCYFILMPKYVFAGPYVVTGEGDGSINMAGWLGGSGNAWNPQVDVGAITGGSGYFSGTHPGISMTTLNGSGSGMVATITVSDGSVTAVRPTKAGTGYSANSVLTANSGLGRGSGFQISLHSYGYVETGNDEGVYTVTHQNTNAAKSSNPPWYIVVNRIDDYLSAAYDSGTGFIVSASDPHGTGNYITNCAFYRQSDETDFRNGLHFRKTYKQMIVNLNPAAIRFMGGCLSNSYGYASTLYRWSNRTPPTSFCKGMYGVNTAGILQYAPAYNPVDGVHYVVDVVTGTPASMTHGELVQCLIPNDFISPAGTTAAGATITNITNASSAVVTYKVTNNGTTQPLGANAYNVGDVIQFSYCNNMSKLNGRLATITAVNNSKNQFTINLDTSNTSYWGAWSNGSGLFGLYVTLNVGSRGDFPMNDMDGMYPLATGALNYNGGRGVIGGYAFAAAASWVHGATTITMSQNNPHTGGGFPGIKFGTTVYNRTTREVIGTVSSWPSNKTTLTLTAGAKSASSGSSDILCFCYMRTFAFDKNMVAYIDSNGSLVWGAWVSTSSISQFSLTLWNNNSNQSGQMPYEIFAQLIWELEQHIIANGLQSTHGPISPWINIPHNGLLSMDPDHSQADNYAIQAVNVMLNGNAGYPGIPPRCSLFVEYSNETFNGGGGASGQTTQLYCTAFSVWRWHELFNGGYAGNQYAACWSTCLRSAVMINDIRSVFGNEPRIKPVITDFPFGLDINGAGGGSPKGVNGYARCFATTSTLTQSQCPYIYDRAYPFDNTLAPITHYWAYSDGGYMDPDGKWNVAHLASNLAGWLRAGNKTAISSITPGLTTTVTTATPHGFQDGNTVVFSNMNGLGQYGANPSVLSGIPGIVSNATANTFTVNIDSKSAGHPFVGGNVIQMDSPNQERYCTAYLEWMNQRGGFLIPGYTSLARANAAALARYGRYHCTYEGWEEMDPGSYNATNDEQFWFLCACKRSQAMATNLTTMLQNFKSAGSTMFAALNILGEGKSPRWSMMASYQPTSYSFAPAGVEWSGLGKAYAAMANFNNRT